MNFVILFVQPNFNQTFARLLWFRSICSLKWVKTLPKLCPHTMVFLLQTHWFEWGWKGLKGKQFLRLHLNVKKLRKYEFVAFRSSYTSWCNFWKFDLSYSCSISRFFQSSKHFINSHASIVQYSVPVSLNDLYLHHILCFKEQHSLALNNDIVLPFSESSISVCMLKKRPFNMQLRTRGSHPPLLMNTLYQAWRTTRDQKKKKNWTQLCISH